jgi:hypothetical protein
MQGHDAVSLANWFAKLRENSVILQKTEKFMCIAVKT